MYDFEKIMSQFSIDGRFNKAIPYGEGHINETFAVYTSASNAPAYILQKINSTLFKDVPSLMNNIGLVTEFLSRQPGTRADCRRECLTIIKTVDGLRYYFDGLNYWRVYVFISNATGYQVTPDAKIFAESGFAFGNFAFMLGDFNADLLSDTIPNFHDTRKRYTDFLSAVLRNDAGRRHGIVREIKLVKEQSHLCNMITDRLSAGDIPLRVTHNDTKLNNVLIDNKTGRAVAVIDLDTVMKGSLCWDFGDSVRFGCNSTREDEADLSRVRFMSDYFKAYTSGYLRGIGTAITQSEVSLLADSALVMTYECGMRFLTDYLDGDKYFKVSDPNQNLIRARVQFRLLEEMQLRLPELRCVVEEEFGRISAVI